MICLEWCSEAGASLKMERSNDRRLVFEKQYVHRSIVVKNGKVRKCSAWQSFRRIRDAICDGWAVQCSPDCPRSFNVIAHNPTRMHVHGMSKRR